MTALRRITIAALAGGCLLMGLVLPQTAAAQTLQRPNASTVIMKPAVTKPSAVQRLAPDNTLGMALLGARMNSDGTLANGSGVTSVSHPVPGLYIVNFDRNVQTNCNYAAMSLGTLVVIRIVAFFANQLQFNVNKTSDSTLTDGAFSVIVFCPK